MTRLALAATVAMFMVACTASDDPADLLPLEYPDAGDVDGGEPGPDGGKTDDVDPDPVRCEPGFDVIDDECVLDGDAKWDVRIIDGTFSPKQPSGGNWDLNNSPPDGYVWIEFGPERIEIETEVDSEKLDPEWNASVLWAVTTNELRSHFDLRLYDYDQYDIIDGDDLMAGCLLPFPDQIFQVALFDANDIDPDCPNVRMSITIAN